MAEVVSLPLVNRVTLSSPLTSLRGRSGSPGPGSRSTCSGSIQAGGSASYSGNYSLRAFHRYVRTLVVLPSTVPALHSMMFYLREGCVELGAAIGTLWRIL
jgi:hypothetical protein